MVNPDKILFRASGNGKIMTEPRSKSEPLSETAKQACIDAFILAEYDRQRDITNKYVKKGLQVEEDSITLYSRLTKIFFKKNEEHLKNDFIQGTPDTFIGESIQKAEVIIDAKSSWDIFTFFKAKFSPLNKDYYWQGQSYMALTGAKEFRLAYCLIDTPEALINDEKRKFMWQACIGDENEVTEEVFALIEKNMLFSDIPMEDRMHEVVIQRNDDDIQKLYNRVIECRYWIKNNLIK